MGYIDQYILFPAQVKWYLSRSSADTLYVFTDQAQGPWLPLVAKRHHVMHCHDFLAQLAAKNKIEECQTSWTGKRYQSYIRNGYRKGKHFICISNKTKADLEALLPEPPLSLSVVYNGLTAAFKPISVPQARTLLEGKTTARLSAGYCLHVGGNQWYKNREGVVDLYTAWRAASHQQLPLLLIGAAPDEALQRTLANSACRQDIFILCNIDDEFLHYAYTAATVLIFPSLAEGFGWPIAEAMASGCLVITTNEAPMTEVAGDAGFYLPRRTLSNKKTWANEAALTLQKVLSLSPAEREIAVDAAIRNAKRFDAVAAMDQIEHIYQHIAEHPSLAPEGKTI